MIEVTLIGTAMIVATVIIESVVIALAVSVLDRYAGRLSRLRLLHRNVILLSCLSLWLLGGITIALWLWAAMFVALGEFESIA